MDPFQRVQKYLQALRRRMRSVATREATGVALILMLSGAGVGLSVALLAGAGDGRWGWAPIGVAAGTAAWLGHRLWWTPRLANRTDLSLARWVERRITNLHSGVVTAVETAPMVSKAGANAAKLGFSPLLARAAAARAADSVERVPPRTLVDGRRAVQLTRLALLVVASWIVASLVSPRQMAEAFHNLVSPAPMPQAQDVSGRTVDVLVGDLALRLVAPAYLELQPKEVVHTRGEVTGVAGTVVSLSGTVLAPASSVALVFEAQPDARWPIGLSPEGVVSGSFRIGESDRYQFMALAPDGLTVKERAWRSITARADQAPEITLVAPDSDLVVHAGDEVPLVYEAFDDHGLAEIALVTRRVGGDEPPGKRALRSPQRDRNLRGSDALSVAQLDLEPGESVDIWLEAADANTVTGPGIGRSATRRLTMYSPEQAHEALLHNLEEIIDRLIDRLGDRLESPIADKKLGLFASYLGTQRQIHQATLPILAELEALATSARTDPLASDTLQTGLAEVSSQLRDGHETEAGHLERASAYDVANARPATTLDLLHTTNQELITALEDAASRLKELLDQSRQDKVLEKGRELLEATGDLMDILKQMKQGGDQKALAEAARKKLEELAKQLQRMESEMQKLAERAPYENQNLSQDSSGAQRDLQSVASQLEKVQELLAQGKIDEAMALLDEVQRQAQQTVAGLEQDFSGQRGGGGSRKLQQMHQELSELADGQRGLHQENQEISRRLEQEALQSQPGALDEARQKARRIQEQLDAVDDEALHPEDRTQLAEAKREAKALEESLDRPDLEQGQEKAAGLAERAGKLADEVGASEAQEADESRAGKLAHGEEQMRGAAEDARKLADALSKLGAPAEPGPKDRQELGRLGRRQGELGKEIARLGSELEGEGMEGLSERLGERFSAAQEAMQQATERLGQHDSRKSGKSQAKALAELEEAIRDLEQAQQAKGNRGNSSAPGISRPDEKVAIPEDDKKQLPFREELLRVMREKAPDAFRAEIERYYRELIK
jgi:archaellum component FlaC